MNSDWYFKAGQVNHRMRAQAWDGPMDPYIMQVHLASIPNMVGEENSFRRIPMTPSQIREAYASRLAEDKMRMDRWMGNQSRARMINLNVSDPEQGTTIMLGNNWLEIVNQDTLKRYGKSRMITDPDVLRRIR